MTQIKCILVMPAYNESECIEAVISQWIGAFDKLFQERYRLLVVNDGSRDNTGEILDRLTATNSKLLVVHQKNAGHGAALMTGYKEAVRLNSEYIFHVDSDDQFTPDDFSALWLFREQTPLALGFRKTRNDALHRLIITRILRSLIYLVFGVYIKDANVPYRLFKTEYLEKMLKVLPAEIFAPNIFLALLAAKDGHNLIGVPVAHKERETGVVSIVRWNLIKICMRCVRELIYFRMTLTSRIANLRTMIG